ncbi:hypothetical protein K2173_014564 [Erythroxylum novogranatense]|uniref:Uncharacterized protein n=1 Tax=Erythroxylum novogranatense TaxID=1862640 RepID=A0AAV8TEY2_9ROSI|nr:hypothetical protein K2173_014564 [Erythroxylum novogranatense]
MASDDEKWENCETCLLEEEEDEEEALSLCDLPVIAKENRSSEGDAETTESRHQEDFDFNPWSGRQSTESEMCAADDIFFQGQILPHRLSVSSECGFNKFSKLDTFDPGRSLLRSESMDRYSLGWSTSFSSRSSSGRSHQSSSSNGSSVAIKARIPKPRVSNQFISHHQSPRPQIRQPVSQMGRNPASNRTSKSSVWNILRRGLVRTPEIELQDLKFRNSTVSRNSSASSSSSNFHNFSQIDNNNSRIRSCNSTQDENLGKVRKHRTSDKRGGFLSDCSCSVSAVKPVPLNRVIIRNSNSSTPNNVRNDRIVRESIKEQQKQLKIKKKMAEQQGKQAMSRHQTFEWIKQL